MVTTMRIAAISDIHGQYVPDLPDDIDIAIIAGDCTARDTPAQWRHFALWMETLPCAHKILVAGNHDGMLTESEGTLSWNSRIMSWMPSVTYLEDSGIEIQDIKFWGFPWTPMYCDWNFMLEEDEMEKQCQLIPDDTNVLISHGPAKRCLDQVANYRWAGCEKLRDRIYELNELKVHIFGHIHECGGEYQWWQPPPPAGHITNLLWREDDAHRAYNVAHCNRDYVPVNGWRVIEI